MYFRILGSSVTATDDEAGPIDLGGIKQQTVLAALLLAKGQVLSNDRLIDAVWGEYPPAKPHVTLRSYISHLRRVLEPQRTAGGRSRRIVTRAPGYAMSIDPAELDAWQFEVEVESGSGLLGGGRAAEALDVIDRALARWPRNGLGDGVLEPFTNDVTRLDEIHRLGRRIRHEALLALGRHDEALPTLEAAAAAEPYDEGVRGRLMLALYRAGRQAEALECYEVGRATLRNELGLEPSPELRTLEARILANDPGLDWAPAPVDPVLAEPTDRPVRPAPVGRQRESDAIAAALDDSLREGGGALIVVAGEPGIGKSTLVRHAAEMARAKGFAVAIGRCHDGSIDTTLFPWTTAWRDLVGRLDDRELAFVVGSSGPVLTQILPEIGERLGLDEERTTDRFTLFDSVVRTLRHGSQIQPLLIAIEDLHWADENSLRLLALAAESLVDAPVVLMASWRDTEAVGEVVGGILEDIGSKAGPTRFALTGLAAADISQMMDELGLVDDDVAASLATRTGGNPLFIAEMLRSLQATGALASSDTVRDAINGRMRRLPAGTTESLTVAALCVDAFSETTLAAVLDLDEDTVLDQLEAALAAKMIEEDPVHGDRFWFVHDLFAETLNERLSAPRRARLNSRLGTVLEAERAPAAQLAHHFLRGSGPDAALKGAEYALQAAIGATRLFDYDAALRLLEAGVAAVETVDDDPLLADLLFELIHVQKHTSQPPVVHETAVRAFEVARRVGDVRRMTKVTISFEGSSGISNEDTDPTWLGYWCPPGVIIPMIEQCIEKLPADDPHVPELWTALAFQYFGEYEDLAAVDRASRAAVESARLQNYPPQLSLALHQRQNALQRVLDLEERTALLDECIANADGQRHPMQTVGAFRARAVLALDRHDLNGARTELARARSVGESSGRALALMNAEVGEVALLLLQGHLEEVERRIDEAFVRYERFGDVMLDQFGMQLSALWREHNRHPEILDLLEYKLEGYPGPAFSAPYAVMLTEMGRLDEAARLVAGFSEQEQTSGGEPILQFLTPSFFAEAAANLEDRALAARMLPAMSAARRRIVSVYDGILLLGSGSLFVGRLQLVLGRLDEAERSLAEADEHHRALDAHPANVRVSLARADLGVRRDDRVAVERALADAEQWSLRAGRRWRIEQWHRTNPGWD